MLYLFNFFKYSIKNVSGKHLSYLIGFLKLCGYDFDFSSVRVKTMKEMLLPFLDLSLHFSYLPCDMSGGSCQCQEVARNYILRKMEIDVCFYMS